VSLRDGNYEIYVMNADGANVVRLTKHLASDLYPAWSPDGKQIAFVSGRDDEHDRTGIYVMNPDGTNVVSLTLHVRPYKRPSWSPDGKQIAFSAGFDIYTMNADGTNIVNLTDGPREGSLPSWSPVLSTVVSVSPKAKRIVQWGKIKEQEIEQKQ
jgi:TolB protein